MIDRHRLRSEPPRRAFLAAVAGVAVAGCTGAPTGTPTGQAPQGDQSAGTDDEWMADENPAGSGAWQPAEGLPTDAAVTATTAMADLEVPWDLTFAGGDAFISEREAGVRRIDAAALQTEAALGPGDAETVVGSSDVPDHENPQFGGFLGVAAHPEYPDPPALYLYYSADDDDPANRVIRYDLERDAVTVLVDGIGGPDSHLGGRLTFGPDGHLWITTGDNDEPESARDPGTLAGTVLRITADGDVPPENPAIPDADDRVVTYGHRNPQGIAVAPDGEVFLAEHGPTGRDEISVIDPGADYGWPVARGGPDDPDYDAYADHEAFAPPVVNTGPEATWAPSGGTFYAADAIGAWRNRLLVGGLVSETLHAITLVPDGDGDGDEDLPLGEDGVRYDGAWLDDRYTATAHPLYAGEYGRLRHVEQGPDGSVFLLTSNRDGRGSGEFPTDDDDRIVRIEPA